MRYRSLPAFCISFLHFYVEKLEKLLKARIQLFSFSHIPLGVCVKSWDSIK